MDNITLTKYLKAQGKLSLKCCFNNLIDKEGFDQDLFNIDLETLEKQFELFENEKVNTPSFTPYKKEITSGDSKAYSIGMEACEKGYAGCLLLAGGQGTRLGFKGPKGTFPISLVKQKSLFQLVAEKVKAASALVKKDLLLAIMTSPLNEKETSLFFKKNHFFGLNQSQVFIFSQTMLPMLDFHGALFANSSHTITKGPDGNGSCFQSFFENGPGHEWVQNNIKYLNIILIDNVLADPFDFELLGHLIKNQNEVVLKSCQRKNLKEKVGVIVESKKMPIVIEYNELPTKYFFEKEPPANLSLLTLTLDFAKKMSQIDLPLHKAKKKASFWDFDTNKIINPSYPNSWKYETYLFDTLPFSKSTSIVMYPRSEVFSPLKNLKGEDSLETVQKDLLYRERKIFEKVTQKKAPNTPFELSPQFYYPTDELVERWKSKNIDSKYLL